MKIVVAITAASGGIYARLTLERLLRSSEVSQIALVCSAHALLFDQVIVLLNNRKHIA